MKQNFTTSLIAGSLLGLCLSLIPFGDVLFAQTSPGAMPGMSATAAPGGSGATAGQAQGSTTEGNSGKYAAVPGKWSVQLDDRSNALIVTAPLGKLDEVAKLIEVMDNPSRGARMEERIFKLKYIDRKTLESAIKMVFPRFDAQKQLINVTRTDATQNAGSSSSSGSGSSAGSPVGSSQSGS